MIVMLVLVDSGSACDALFLKMSPVESSFICLFQIPTEHTRAVTAAYMRDPGSRRLTPDLALI